MDNNTLTPATVGTQPHPAEPPPHLTPREPIALTYAPDKQKWIMMFDASAYSRSDCHRNMFYLIVKGLTSGKKDHKMEYGTAFHAALGHYYTHKRHTTPEVDLKRLQAESVGHAVRHFMSPDIEIPDDDYRTPSHLIGCLGQYFNLYAVDPLEVLVLNLPDGTKRELVEQKFCIPFYSDNLLEICLSGTMDLVAYLFDQLVIIDHKSTSATSPYYYLQEYNTSTQLMMYSFIFRKLFPTLVDSYWGIGTMINGIFLRKSGKNDFRRSDVIHFYDETIAAFERHLGETVTRLALSFHQWFHNNVEFAQNFTQCHSKFGCPYIGICTAGALDRENILQNNYVLREYNPLLFQLAEK